MKNKLFTETNTQEKNIEVEIRAFLTKEKYDELLSFFKENAVFLDEDLQETHFLSGEEDLRIQKNKNGSKIWFKTGEHHDDFRKEIELMMKEKDFNDIVRLFSLIGFTTTVKWFRQRKQFLWRDFIVSMDYTKGYGYIIEIEKMASNDEKEKVLEQIKKNFSELNILITPKEEFNRRYREYCDNWQELI